MLFKKIISSVVLIWLIAIFNIARANLACQVSKFNVLPCQGDYDQENNIIRGYSMIDGKPVTRNECPSGWTFYGRTQSCYYVGVGKAYAGASLHCSQNNAYLAYIESKEENDFIVSLATLDISMGPQDMTWIGYQLKNGKWQWDKSDAKASYVNFVDGKLPEANPNYQSCGILYQDIPIGSGKKGDWNSWNCATTQAKFVCKSELKAKNEHFLKCSTEPSLKFVKCEQNQQLFDTLKTKPPFEIADTRCPSGWTYYDPTQSCYYVGTRKSWDSARTTCYDKFSELTSIHTADENQFIASLTQANKKMGPIDQTWIGLRYEGGQWTWTDGSTLDYQNFAANLPNLDKDFTCAALLSDDFNANDTPLKRLQWNNAVCTESLRKFVCKKKKYPDWGIKQ